MTTFTFYLWYYLDLVGSVALLSVLFFVLESLAPAEKRQPLSRRFFNLAYYPTVLVLVLSLTFVINPAFSWLLQFSGGGLLPRVISQPRGLLAQAAFAWLFAFTWDLWQYGIHRLQHAWPVLWETHKFHHSETALNSSGMGRLHFSHHVLYVLLYAPLVVFFGTLAPHAVASFVLFRIWGFVNHANVRLPLGPLTPIIAGPQWHRIHHSIQREHHDKNFAAFFPFIDMLFGTYYRPKPGEYPATGLAGEETVGNLRDATVEPLLGFFRLSKALGVSMRLRRKPTHKTMPIEAA
jgi:sterol desaturase/sphingolipid hydroxylase (fatty acid hydroxylase superfamily)